MTEHISAPSPSPVGEDYLLLGQYAEHAYLEYAMSVARGRALPEVLDGQKPVQRRILFVMRDMGLTAGAKLMKSARAVGEILGKYHPCGDSSAYEAMVRMAQDFTLRYPLIDGTGDFGSRDGDGAVAMRYTEARLTSIAELLLSEINQGTVDFVSNYGGTFDEPLHLSTRLPMVLLDGALGIAVGMTTEVPSHDLDEMTQAAIALLREPTLETADLMQCTPVPDPVGGGQIITPVDELCRIYKTGKGSVRMRARYEIEKLVRGQWRMTVTELPPNANSAEILAEIEEQINPKPKAGKKQLSQDQFNIKKLMLDLADRVCDESDGEHPVRPVFESKSSRISTDTFTNMLMAQTSLEGNVPMNLVMMGLDNRPAQKNLKTILQEWLDFRVVTITHRLKFRLNQVGKRLHILEGRLKAFLHIDEVIKIIRESGDPKADLMAASGLTEIQAEDILEIRLHQLARLEGFKLEKELNELREEQGHLNILLGDENEKRKLTIKEMQTDMKQFGDARRTLVEEAGRAVLTQTTADEPIMLILLEKGWIHSRARHNLDLGQTAFKEGDRLKQTLEGRTVLPVVILDSLGRTHTLDTAEIPGGRGDGVPVSSLIELQNGAKPVAMFTGQPEQHYLLSGSGGYGFIAKLADMVGRVKAGKVVTTMDSSETALPSVTVYASSLINPGYKIVLASSDYRLLVFSIGEFKVMSKNRGSQPMSLAEGTSLEHVVVMISPESTVVSVDRRDTEHQEKLCITDIDGKRGKKGKVLEISDRLKGLS